MHKSDYYLIPSVFVVIALAILHFFVNHGFTFIPKDNVFMKPAAAPGAMKVGSRPGNILERGAGVLFVSPLDGFMLGGRIIATEGQTVEVRDGIIYIDGAKLEEAYLSKAVTKPAVAPIRMPARTLFILQDERSRKGSASLDSRTLGPIPLECVTEVFSLPLEGEKRGRR